MTFLLLLVVCLAGLLLIEPFTDWMLGKLRDKYKVENANSGLDMQIEDLSPRHTD